MKKKTMRQLGNLGEVEQLLLNLQFDREGVVDDFRYISESREKFLGEPISPEMYLIFSHWRTLPCGFFLAVARREGCFLGWELIEGCLPAARAFLGGNDD